MYSRQVVASENVSSTHTKVSETRPKFTCLDVWKRGKDGALVVPVEAVVRAPPAAHGKVAAGAAAVAAAATATAAAGALPDRAQAGQAHGGRVLLGPDGRRHLGDEQLRRPDVPNGSVGSVNSGLGTFGCF